MARFTLYINFRENIVEYPLPAVNNRNVTLDISALVKDCSLRFEVFDDVWSILPVEGLAFKYAGKLIGKYEIKDGDFIRVQTLNGESFVVMVYAITPNVTEFNKYCLEPNEAVTIGKLNYNDICICDRFISDEHAILERHDNIWFITDRSLNGTYINGKRIRGTIPLRIFDVVYTVGLKMVFLGDCIAINRRDIVSSRLKPMRADTNKIRHFKHEDDTLFYRSPRRVEPLFDEAIEIEPPPNPNRRRNQPLIFVVGPSVTMPLPILMSTLINTQINSQTSFSYVATIASVGVSAIVGAGWATAHYIYNKKHEKGDEKFRREAYKTYIAKSEKMIQEKQSYNNSVLLGQYMTTQEIIERTDQDNRFLWNRNINHSDFLTIRLGNGSVKFSAPLVVPKQRFSLYMDDMSELPHKLYEKYEYMTDTASLIELNKHKIIGVIGSYERMRSIAADIIVQVAALHCYTDVKIAAFFKESEYDHYGWMRWLPHVNTDDMRLRMIADDASSYQNVLYYINSVLRTRYESAKGNEENSAAETDKTAAGHNKAVPHYVVLCTSETIFDGDGIEKYISASEDLGFTFVLLYGAVDKLPNECKMILQCDDNYSGKYNLEERRSDADRVNFERVDSIQAEKFAKIVSRLRIRQFSAGEIPNSIEYFDMIGIGKLEQWDLIKKYKENRVYEGIRAFMGIGIGGRPLYLDIHEKKHGPHGLVAGTTGSGKSEALQTFIISLAMNYHPDEVAFILIDYKGGGMANAFIGMPHIAGTITNLGGENSQNGELDSGLTRRALVSIKSEIRRRQAIFNRYKVNHIDMYIRLYRENKADEPLPHLIIISDEFAELKKEQPEFIKELVSTARVGRSLGIHLILATQKPGGVVDDEIWSNARFKLCLRVQDKQDSMGMLKRPEAAYLTQTGRAYLQIGNNEIFEQFQTGYSGADYQPKDEVSADSEFSMIVIDGTPAVVREHKKEKKANSYTQLEAAVRYISEVCEENRISAAKALWLPIIPSVLPLEDMSVPSGRNGITAVFGVVDDPEKQSRLNAQIDLASCSNLIIAGVAGMGKTTMLQTILFSLITEYTCEQVVYYVLDFSGRTLKIFEKDPHCGVVAFSDDNEAVERLFKFVENSINERKKIFNDYSVGSYSEYRGSEGMPLMLVIIDNYFSFSELYPNLQEDFSRITRDCAKYGIQVIVTVNHLNDMRYKTRQNFGDYLTLIMSDKSDYHEVWGKAPEFLPKNTKGRGLIGIDGRLLEYQTALPVSGESESERNGKIVEIVADIAKRESKLKKATPVPILPVWQSYSEFYANNSAENMLPVGYVKSDISIYALDLYRTYCYAVSDMGAKGLALVLGNMIYAAANIGGYIYNVRLNRDIRIPEEGDKIISDKNDVIDMLLALKAEFKVRASEKKQYIAENPGGDYAEYICKRHRKIFVFIDSMSSFCNLIYDATNAEDMHTITETFFKQGSGLGIYFFAGFDSDMYGSMFFSAACRCFTAHRGAIHLGGRFDKQKLMTVNLPISQQSKQLDYFIGYVNGEMGSYPVFIPHEKH